MGRKAWPDEEPPPAKPILAFIGWTINFFMTFMISLGWIPIHYGVNAGLVSAIGLIAALHFAYYMGVEAHMFKHCWPFPKQDIIAREFPDQPISDRVYNHAKKFYEDSIDLESQKFLELMRAKNHEAEEKFANLLMRQAVHVALGHMRHSD